MRRFEGASAGAVVWVRIWKFPSGKFHVVFSSLEESLGLQFTFPSGPGLDLDWASRIPETLSVRQGSGEVGSLPTRFPTASWAGGQLLLSPFSQRETLRLLLWEEDPIAHQVQSRLPSHPCWPEHSTQPRPRSAETLWAALHQLLPWLWLCSLFVALRTFLLLSLELNYVLKCVALIENSCLRGGGGRWSFHLPDFSRSPLLSSR